MSGFLVAGVPHPNAQQMESVEWFGQCPRCQAVLLELHQPRCHRCGTVTFGIATHTCKIATHHMHAPDLAVQNRLLDEQIERQQAWQDLADIEQTVLVTDGHTVYSTDEQAQVVLSMYSLGLDYIQHHQAVQTYLRARGVEKRYNPEVSFSA